MKLRFSVIIPALILSACGGGGSGGGSSGSGTSGGGAQPQVSKAFVAPVEGEKRTYTSTYVDTDGASTTYNVYEQISHVNADASYTGAWGQDVFYLEGGPWGSDPWTYTYNSVGDVVGSSVLIQTCTYTFPSGGRPVTMQPGQTWDDTNVATCSENGRQTITTALSGTYLGVENVVVPAGSYVAYKFQLSQVYNANLTVKTTSWYNTSPTDSRLVRQFTQNVYSNPTSGPGQTDHFDYQLAKFQ